jgi:isopenicillin-N epimerase
VAPALAFDKYPNNINNHPRLEGALMLDRRHFLSTAATGVAASLAFRGNLLAQLEKTPPLPDRSLLETNDAKNEDAFWAEMRKQFLIPEDEVYLNNGTVGSSPAPVLRAIFDAYNTTEKMDQQDPEDYPCCATPPKRTATSPTAST